MVAKCKIKPNSEPKKLGTWSYWKQKKLGDNYLKLQWRPVQTILQDKGTKFRGSPGTSCMYLY